MKRCPFVLTLLSAAIGQTLHAQELPAGAGAEPAIVTVSAGRGSSLQKMDLATTVLSTEQVRQSPETATEQILNKIPGVFARQAPAAMIHPTGEAFSIRGFGTTTNVNTLVMVDGMPVNDPYFRTIDWSQVPKDAVERIEVIRGGGAATLWGNLAMGGVVNIVTRPPVPDERRIHLSYGSFNTVTTDAALTLLSSPALLIGLNAGWSKSDGYQLTPLQYRNPNMLATASRAGNVSLSAYLTPSRDATYYVKLLSHDLKQNGLPWKNSSDGWKKYQLSGGGTTTLADGARLHMSAWYNKGEMDSTNAGVTPSFNILQPAIGTPYVAQIEQAKYSSAGGSLFYQRDIGEIKDVKIGLDLRQIRADDHINVFTPASQSAALMNQGTHRFAGLFAQATYRPKAVPLDVTLGLRQDFFQTANGSLSGTVGPNVVGSALADQSFRHFDPRIGAKYYFDSGFDLRAALYRNFAAPGMNQMYRSFVSGTGFTATNPGLTPQTNFGQELGIDYVRPGLNVALTVFHNDLKNFIDAGPLCSGAAACNALIAGTGLVPGSVTTVNQYLNAGNAVLKGAELLGEWQPSQALQLHGGLTRTIAYLTSSAYAAMPSAASPAVPAHAQIGQVPRWVATAGALARATPALTLSIEAKAFPDYWYNTAHTVLNGGATVVDIGFSYRLGKSVDLYGSAQNIGNRGYYDQGLAYTAMNGPTLNTGTIPQRGLPRSATLGLRASF